MVGKRGGVAVMKYGRGAISESQSPALLSLVRSFIMSSYNISKWDRSSSFGVGCIGHFVSFDSRDKRKLASARKVC